LRRVMVLSAPAEDQYLHSGWILVLPEDR
jgi:hypothetical protein